MPNLMPKNQLSGNQLFSILAYHALCAKPDILLHNSVRLIWTLTILTAHNLISK